MSGKEQEKTRRALQMVQAGRSIRSTCTELGLSRSTLQRARKRKLEAYLAAGEALDKYDRDNYDRDNEVLSRRRDWREFL